MPTIHEMVVEAISHLEIFSGVARVSERH